MPGPNELKQIVIELLAPKLEAFNITRGQVGDDFHFLDSGIMDSFGVVELVTQIQERAAIEVDFSDFDPQEFLTLGGLVSALQRCQGS